MRNAAAALRPAAVAQLPRPVVVALLVVVGAAVGAGTARLARAMVPVRRRPVLAVDADRLCLGLLNDCVADRTNAEGPGSPAPFRLRIAHRAGPRGVRCADRG